MARPTVAKRRSPWQLNTVENISFTVGTEALDAIAVAVQLKDQKFRDLTRRGQLDFYLSSDANGDTVLPAHLMPSGGYAAGADGTVLRGVKHDEGLVAKGTLAIDAAPEKFKTTTTAVYRVGGAQYSKAAATAIVFTAAHVVAAAKFGVVLVQVNAAGTVTTKVPGATQTTPMAYNTAALALAALPAPDAGNVVLGWITLDNSGSDGSSAGAWVAITDDLTDASDITAAAFVDAPENGQYPPQFAAVSEADGDIDVVVTHVGVRTMYLCARMPDGRVEASGAITFA